MQIWASPGKGIAWFEGWIPERLGNRGHQCWHTIDNRKKQRICQKEVSLCFIDYKPLTVLTKSNSGMFSGKGVFLSISLSLWRIHTLSIQSMHWQDGLCRCWVVPDSMHLCLILYLSPYLLNMYVEYIMRETGLDEDKWTEDWRENG